MDVALARLVTQLPTGPSWAYEIKVDGHRTVLWRTEDGVRLQSRTGRDVTALWMDLAVAAMSLPPGVILDGEAVVYVAADDGTVHISFAAAQSRALSLPRRARELANQHPATYVAFDILAHPAAGFPDLRPQPYTERRQVLLDVLADIGPPIVPVWSTTDLDEALLWFETLEGTGVEGIVAKPLRSAYKAGRVWAKVRHADTVDATVVGFTGTVRRPKALAVRLPDGRVALSQRLTTALASVVGPRLVPEAGRAFTEAGDSYTPAVGDVVMEVMAGTTRHAVVTVMRLR
ncbi:ATP-dependent DNA ligase [Streptomyces canus]|uniref:ATP-dependent DNA ligase n=1 Tax=Streptomyces canus TaxID=58343 RepID=A0AAW8F3M1_9ACTN|nr:RNA ligase family protein [Streptomyces canus]MDQ0904686.1 ATP-dependent DNA ligase [Streptomyces canus]